MKKYSVSLCMIVKNEEKFLERCLQSVVNIVDEIIVVDTGSTDLTVEIAQNNNAKVFHFQWINDFSAARNYAIDKAISDYILILDADEYLDESVDFQSDLADSMDYYIVKNRNFLGNGEISYHYNTRLFKNNIGLHYSGALHEHLNTIDPDSKYTEGKANFIINHDGYTPEVFVEKNKKERNLKIMEKEVKKNPSGYNLFNMGKTLLSNQRYEEALDYFFRSYHISKDRVYLKSLIMHMVDCLNKLHRYQDVLTLLHPVIKKFPRFTDFYYELGNAYIELGYFFDAEIAFKKCLELGDADDVSVTEGIGSHLAKYRLAYLYYLQNRHSDAFDAAYQVIQLKKHHRPSLLIYVDSMMKAHISPEESFAHLNQIYLIEEMTDLQMLISVLYELRHPLLLSWFKKGKGEISPDYWAIAFQYAHQYEEALLQWKNVLDIPVDNWLDIVVLALLLNQEDLVDKGRHTFNLSDKEWKSLKNIIMQNQDKKITLTSTLEMILFKAIEQLIRLQEFTPIEYISTYLLQGSIDTIGKLVHLLESYGYIDTAIDLLHYAIANYPKNAQIKEQFADILTRNGYYEDALIMYKEVMELNNQYKVNAKICNVYMLLGDIKRSNETKEHIKSNFPSTLWLSENRG